MLIQTLAETVHKNAVAHGWWDDERNLYQVIALIHSEWSEALEEARADRPMLYYDCALCEKGPCRMERIPLWEACDFQRERHKPEGIAVELIDGVIRILDFLGYIGVTFHDPETGAPAEMESLWETDGARDDTPEDLPTLIAFLHKATSDALPCEERMALDINGLMTAMSMAMTWVHMQGADPLQLLLEKHQFNTLRPYKHGKRF